MIAVETEGDTCIFVGLPEPKKSRVMRGTLIAKDGVCYSIQCLLFWYLFYLHTALQEFYYQTFRMTLIFVLDFCV